MQKLILADTSVSHDRHKCPTQRTQVPDNSDTCVSQTPPTGNRICRHCWQQLPASAFYMRNRLHTPDSYCKECRKAANRLRRKSRTPSAPAPQSSHAHLVITNVEQRDVRLKLIMHALQTVHQRIDRQREKLHQEELRKEWNGPSPLYQNH